MVVRWGQTGSLGLLVMLFKVLIIKFDLKYFDVLFFSLSWHSGSVFEFFSFSMPHLFSLSASVWWSPGHKSSSFVTSVGALKNLLFLVTQILGGIAYLGNIANILRQYYKMQNAAWHEQLETWEYLKSSPHIVFITLWNVLIWLDLRSWLAK